MKQNYSIDGVTLEGEPLDRSMYMSYGGSVGLESLLLAYEADF